MSSKLLLLKDVLGLGRAGDLVDSPKPGYVRNYLLPQKYAVIANKSTLRMREKIQEERNKQAILDKEVSDRIAASLADVTLTTVVKVDPEGHMYGSVSALDIVHMLNEQKGITIDKKSVLLKHPIKSTGNHTINLKLEEGVTASFKLHIQSEAEAAEEIKAAQ